MVYAKAFVEEPKLNVMFKACPITNCGYGGPQIMGFTKGGVVRTSTWDMARCNITLEDCPITGCTAVLGGVIMAEPPFGTGLPNSVGFRLERCLFSRCGSFKGDGAVVYLKEIPWAIVHNCTFSHCFADVGIIYAQTTYFRLTDSVFRFNLARTTGAVLYYQGAFKSLMSVFKRVTLIDNQVADCRWQNPERWRSPFRDVCGMKSGRMPLMGSTVDFGSPMEFECQVRLAMLASRL